MTVLDNVKIASRRTSITTLPTASAHEKVLEHGAGADRQGHGIPAHRPSGDKAGQLASSLPYGQQRKLEIARALATNMKLLLLDEPAAGMNPTETAELLSCINTIRDTFHVAILLIEHDMEPGHARL